MRAPYNLGIILRHSTAKNKIELINHEDMRIEAYCSQEAIVVGSLISYSITSYRAHAQITNIEIIDVPLLLVRNDVLFFHHILELCYYFIPVGSCIKNVFNFVCLLYDPAYADCSKNIKNFFIGKLLILIGHYPDLPDHMPLLDQIRKMDIDISEIETIDLKGKQMLKHWIKRCLAEHPMIANFNTIHFLMNE
jgi:hypothetical protein